MFDEKEELERWKEEIKDELGNLYRRQSGLILPSERAAIGCDIDRLLYRLYIIDSRLMVVT